MTADPHAERVAALAEDVWNDFSPFITITHRDAESIARSVLASPAMRDLLADERARALREAADEARVRGDVPVTAITLRYAATHEAMNRSWIFDVLMGVADQIEATDDQADRE